MPAEPAIAVVEPGKTEDRATFISRCMHEEKAKFKDEKQRLAVCFSKWKNQAKANVGCPDPTDGEDHQAYLDRCSVDHPAADCEKAWAMAQGDQSGDGHMMPHQQHLLSVFNVAQSIPSRRETLNDVEHVVLPLVALVSGVFQCANCSGPNYYAETEFGKNVQAWNGRPVTYGHPMRADAYVSAGSPDVWQKERIGTTFNSRLADGKLHMEAWLDMAAVERAGAGELLKTAEAGGQVEVSTAAWIDEVPRVGSHNGKSYSVAQANFQPDHLALLPLGQKGACNWADGCGVRVASVADVSEDPAEPKTQCCDACARGEPCASGLTDDEKAVVDEIAAAMEVLTRHGFDVSFEEDGEMAEDQKTGAAVPEATPSDAKTEQPKTSEQAKAAEHVLSTEQRRIAELEAKVEHLTAQAAAKPKAQTVDEYIDQAPAALRDTLLQLHKAAERRRLELIDKVKQAPGNMFSEEQLNAMQEKDLLPLVALVARTDFSIQPPVNSRYASEGDDYAELPPSVWPTRDPHKAS